MDESQWSEFSFTGPGDGDILVTQVSGFIVIRDSRSPFVSGLVFTKQEYADFCKRVGVARPRLARVTAGVAMRAAVLAAMLAGRRRSHLREIWLADLWQARLAGELTFRAACGVVCGYAVCAVRMRVTDLCGWCRGVLAAIIASPGRTHLAIGLVVGAWVLKNFCDQGFDGVTSNVQNFAVAWVGMATAANRIRGKLPK